MTSLSWCRGDSGEVLRASQICEPDMCHAHHWPQLSRSLRCLLEMNLWLLTSAGSIKGPFVISPNWRAGQGQDMQSLQDHIEDPRPYFMSTQSLQEKVWAQGDRVRCALFKNQCFLLGRIWLWVWIGGSKQGLIMRFYGKSPAWVGLLKTNTEN